MRHVRAFFKFARERENIRLRRLRGCTPPWTDDPELQQFFFCNIFREHDKTTVWFRENVRDKVAEDAGAAFRACVAFRWFNSITTGQAILPWLVGPWDKDEVFRVLNGRRAAGEKIFGGAYIISSPLGDPKLEWAVKCATEIIGVPGTVPHTRSGTLQEMHEVLMTHQGLGPFMAYEIVTDLRHTCVLWNASDIFSWASPGPGCARGLGWVMNGDPGTYKYGSKRMSGVMLKLMRYLLVEARRPENWPWTDRPWEMREVEHTLCEYAKYKVAQAGGRMKRRYKHHE